MDSYECSLKAKVWIYEGAGGWHFVTVPKEQSSKINERFGAFHRGWGSIPVTVTIGKSVWRTSIFWEKRGTYILAIKKQIRRNENIVSADIVKVNLLIENVI